MLGEKFYKENYSLDEYSKCAEWCNNNGATIQDMGEYYECVAIPPTPLEDVKDNKINELKAARDAEEQTPVSYGGYLWDFDDKAIQRINGAIIALGESGTITWTSADNEEIKKVTAADLRGVISASALRSNELHIKYRQLREQVENAKTVEDVKAVQW